MRWFGPVAPTVVQAGGLQDTDAVVLGRDEMLPALDGTVVYTGDDLDTWEEGARAMLPGWMVDDLRAMFSHFVERGLAASDEDLELCRGILGREPRRFDDFVAETVAMWGLA